jgi:hypothetical protein
VLVVEGYMDVVMLDQHGVDNAVATLGTAITPIRPMRLLRLANEVVFAFDGDAAGRKAAWRALENSLPQARDGKLLSFLFLPDGEDPDSFVRAKAPMPSGNCAITPCRCPIFCSTNSAARPICLHRKAKFAWPRWRNPTSPN